MADTFFFAALLLRAQVFSRLFLLCAARCPERVYSACGDPGRKQRRRRRRTGSGTEQGGNKGFPAPILTRRLDAGRAERSRISPSYAQRRTSPRRDPAPGAKRRHPKVPPQG